MSSKNPSRETVYSQFVKTNLPAMIKAGQGAYTVNECAVMVGLKPTQHFKRRIRQLAAEGVLRADAVFTPRGGLTAVYSIPESQKEEFPF